MDSNGDEHVAPPRPDQDSPFPFAAPPNPRNMAGRKRARTLESPQSAPDPHDPGDDAKVKGGHSLRKRARIDYALMNEHEDDDHTHSQAPPTHATDGTVEITVSGTRSARKRRATADPNYDLEEAQPGTGAPQKKKPRTGQEKQRSVSPVPQRRPYPKRKSTVAAAILSLDSPHKHQPSDTELQDTIEVGAPLHNQANNPSSSQPRPSDTASNVSAPSPLKKATLSQAIASSEPTPQSKSILSIANGAKLDPAPNGAETGDAAVVPPTTPYTPAVPLGLNKTTETGAALPTLSPSNQNGLEYFPEPDQNLPVDSQPSDPPRAPSEAADSTHAPSSRESSIDSDTTEIVPPTLIPTTTSSFAGPSAAERSRMANRGRTRQAAVAAQPPEEEPEEAQQVVSKPGFRPRVSRFHQNASPASQADLGLLQRQRASRLADNTAAVHQDEQHASQPPKEKVTPGGRKSDDKSVVPEETGPSSPDTPRRRGPGRPPKGRVLPEPEPAKTVATRAKERRASRTAPRLDHPRPTRSHLPRDFSFLTPFHDSRDLYPEITQDQESGMPTPLETPNPQPSDAVADDQAEDASSLGPEKEPGSQDPQTALDGDAVYDAPTPATGVESAAPSRNASPEPMIESIRKPKTRQYAFPRIRSPTEFINQLDGYKTMSDDDLGNILAASAKALEAWQDEWKQQKAIVDDEDNAVRRRAHDVAFVARETRDLAKSTGSATVEKKDFEVKGIRADRVQTNKADFPLSNPEAYERRQDMVAAQAWGFAWDPRPSMIGKQDPIAQREGLTNTRLRNRPKLSQRAAEAAGEEPAGIVPGKRTRKPRILSDESKEPSRAPTPVEPAKPKRRRRRNMEAELVESDNEAPEQQPEEPQPEAEAPPPPPPAAPPAKKPYTGKKRGPKPKAEREALARAAAEREAIEQEAAEKAAREKAAQEAAAQEAAAQEKAAQENPLGDALASLYAHTDASGPALPEQSEATTSQPKTRKRRRAAAGPEIQPQDVPTASIEDIQLDGPANRQAPHEDEPPALKRQRTRKPKVEIPTATFYSAASSAATNNEDTLAPAEDKRPSTASSTSSMRTVESNYSFRQRPRKNYSEMADPSKEVHGEGRPKRNRKRANHHGEQEPTSYPTNLAPVPAPPACPESPQYPMANHGYHAQQQPSVLAPPNNNPFLPPTGGHPGPLLAPSPMRPGHVAAPPVVGGNPFSAPSNFPIEPPAQHSQSPRRKPLRIKIVNRRGQTATPQPDGPPQGAPHSHSFSSMQQVPSLAPLQPPPIFHGHHNGFDSHMYGGPSMNGPGPGQVMFPVNVNAALGTAMAMPPAMHHAPPLPPLGTMQGQGSVSGSRANSKPPGSGRATPAPSSAASSTGGGGQGGDEALSEKDYASMTKSEKMSASMKGELEDFS